MEWMNHRKDFLPLMIVRRYLKLTFDYCDKNNLLDKNINELVNMELPFKVQYLPTEFPKPSKLILNISEKEYV